MISMGAKIIMIGIQKGKFHVCDEHGEHTTQPLNPVGLREGLDYFEYDPNNQNHLVLCSSSVDFPQEYGAPKKFKFQPVFDKAMKMIRGE